MIKYHNDLIQGSDEWLQARCGLLTASEMKLIVSPTFKIANNDKTRAHVYELAAQRVTNYVEPHYIGDDMLRGHADEVTAKIKYSELYAPVDDAGFITNDKFGFTIGYSPDGLVGDDGLVECKSRRQKFQIQTVIDGDMPDEFTLQVQTGLMVSERKWCDFVSYCGGMHMFVHRVFADLAIQSNILEAANAFEHRVRDAVADYKSRLTDKTMRLAETERVIEQEIY